MAENKRKAQPSNAARNREQANTITFEEIEESEEEQEE
jgi:hypothetical protein